MSFECEWLDKLLVQFGGDRKVHSNIPGRAPLRVIVRSKDMVPRDGNFAEVRVCLLLMSAVVPTMQLRSVDDVAEHAAAHFDVRVSQNVPKPPQGEIPHCDLAWNTKQHCDWRAYYGADKSLTWVESSCVDGGKTWGTVMH